jgi:hypothetical protein
MAGFLLYGLTAKNDRARAVAFDSIVSSVIASKAITPALKELTRRERPNGGDADAFPSNHATQAFAVASVIAAHYDDRRWVKWAAYSLATGVGIARVYHGAHWTSDVLAGAAIGSFVGNTVVATNRAERARWRVTPCSSGSVSLCLCGEYAHRNTAPQPNLGVRRGRLAGGSHCLVGRVGGARAYQSGGSTHQPASPPHS